MHAEILRDVHSGPSELSEIELDHITGGLAFLAVAEAAVVGFAIIGTAAVVVGGAYYAATGKNPAHLIGL